MQSKGDIIMEDKIKEKILQQYLNSDFNGLPFSEFAKHFDSVSDAKICIKKLVEDGDIDIVYNGTNPHIKGFDFSKNQEQFLSELLNVPDDLERELIRCGRIEIEVGNKYSCFCLYPSKKLLEQVNNNDRRILEMPPFKKMLCFGAPQLEFVYFRIDVLDRYLEDPRYDIRYGDYYGQIYFNMDTEDNPEDVYLKYFGIAYNIETRENLICAFICDLAKMNDRHQYHFFSYMEQPNDKIVPEYNFYKNQILGEWAEECSIFDAFLEEIKTINKMTKIICNQQLFINEFSDEDRKKLTNFHPFLKPTKKSFELFCQTLDKLFTENLDSKVILSMNKLNGSKMPLKYKPDGSLEMGSLALLKMFIETYFKPKTGENVAKMIIDIWDRRETGIRAIRSKSSHFIRENQYDIKIFGEYNKIMYETYESVRLIRLVLANHPAVKLAKDNGSLKIPDWLFEGKIKNYFISPENN